VRNIAASFRLQATSETILSKIRIITNSNLKPEAWSLQLNFYYGR
jgi:hypothetical protein